MDRREFSAQVALFTLALGGAVSAQPVRKVYRIGILGLGTTSDMAGPQPSWPSTRALLSGMRDLGYTYGEQYVTEPRGAGGNPDRFPELAAELVRLKVDVILAGGGPTVRALMRATTTIPIVMAASADPVADGYVRSLAHPGGNITGLSLQSTEATAKRIEQPTKFELVINLRTARAMPAVAARARGRVELSNRGNVCLCKWVMAALGVRRVKAALSSG